eukprot:TRINITY_DN5320_c0_g4_i2.p1 TRINITY_DN5320_c0_g4~~TRINITY_DN5320_c0_g4_i2.p1  ORF type:complete len:272 (-),score=52.70 TRINITY_DN5320_c0_g4_i2:328-1143(-)
MKQKSASRRSPVNKCLPNDCEVPEEFTDEVNSKHTPNALIVNKKGVRLTRNKFGQTTTFKRKARSNSPKDDSLSKQKHKPPTCRRNSPAAHTKTSPLLANAHSGRSPGQHKKATSHAKNSPDDRRRGSQERGVQKLCEELWEAAEKGDVGKIGQLAKVHGVDVNSMGIENRTALHYAVYENKLDSARLLVTLGVTIDARTIHQRTSLHIACILGEEAMCQFLLDKGAAVNAQDFDMNTPTHYAAFYSRLGDKRRECEDTEAAHKKEAGPVY